MRQFFESDIANKYGGIEEAILLELLYKLLTRKSRYVCMVDGKVIRIKFKDLLDFVPCLNFRKAQWAIYKLRDNGALIIKRNKLDCFYLIPDPVMKDLEKYYKED